MGLKMSVVNILKKKQQRIRNAERDGEATSDQTRNPSRMTTTNSMNIIIEHIGATISTTFTTTTTTFLNYPHPPRIPQQPSPSLAPSSGEKVVLSHILLHIFEQIRRMMR
jgi:hypothetical protein